MLRAGKTAEYFSRTSRVNETSEDRQPARHVREHSETQRMQHDADAWMFLRVVGRICKAEKIFSNASVEVFWIRYAAEWNLNRALLFLGSVRIA